MIHCENCSTAKRITGGTEMKSVLISIQPKWVEKIVNGEKTIEVRKTRPKIETPFKAYIYCTKAKEDRYILERHENGFATRLDGKVIGEFVCDKIYDLFPFSMGTGIELFDAPISLEKFCKESCLTEQEICDYIGEKDGYGWRISDLKIYDKPKELSEFRKACPDKFRYCEICKYGSVVLSPDEEEYALYHGGHYDCYDTVCHNIVPRPPQSWCYVKEIDE